MTTDGGSAGTAANHYRAGDAGDHPYQPTTPEPGERPRCRHNCGRGKDQHAKGTT